MTTIDRTCGCEFHYILTTIMICLENINKDHMKQPKYIALYDLNYELLNKLVAIYNNNFNNFNHLPKNLKDKIIEYISRDIEQNVLTEFEKIMNQKSDYGTLSAEELKEAEEEFFKF